MRRFPTGPLWLACCALASSECSLDETGLLGPSRLDAGSRSDGRPSTDAKPETSRPDTGARDAMGDAKPLDSGHDAPMEAAGPTYCSTVSPVPLFCDDFDGDFPALSPPWDSVDMSAGAISITGTVESSPPSSVSFALNAQTACRSSTLSKGFSTSYGTLDLSFDLYPDAGAGLVASVALTTGFQVDLSFGQPGQGETYIQQNAKNRLISYHNFAQFPAPSTWVRVTLEIALAPVSRITVSLDGTAVHTVAIDPGKLLDAHGAPTIYIGPTCYNKAPARQLYYDNVVFDAF